MEGRLGRLAHRAADKATHLRTEDKNNLGDGLLLVAAFTALCSVPTLSNLGGYVALGTAALSAVTGAILRLEDKFSKTGIITTAAGVVGDIGAATLIYQDASGLNPSRVPTDAVELFAAGAVTGIGAAFLVTDYLKSRRQPAPKYPVKE